MARRLLFVALSVTALAARADGVVDSGARQAPK